MGDQFVYYLFIIHLLFICYLFIYLFIYYLFIYLFIYLFKDLYKAVPEQKQ